MSNQAKVGIFSTISVIIFVLGFYFLKGTNLFVRTNVYYAVYDRVDGLYKSNEVDINGFRVGRVSNMARNPVTGKIIVTLDLDKDVQIPKSDSTVALLVSTDFLGSKKVSLILGNSTEYYQDGDTIHTLFKKDLTEQLGAQIDPIMVDVKKMLPQLDSTIRGIKLLFDVNNPKSIFTTLGQVNSVLAGMDSIVAQNEINLQKTLKNIESITANIEKNNDAITVILKNAESITDSIEKANLKQMIDNLNLAVTQVNDLLKDINNGNGTLGKVIKNDELYNKIDTAVAHLDGLLKDVKERPYRYISINVLGSKKAEQRREVKYNESVP